jgi:hypothetical protein
MARLVTAAFWCALGGGLLAWHAFRPHSSIEMVASARLSAAVAFALALYNLARWWSDRSYQRKLEIGDRARQDHHRAGKEARPATPPNPDFDFSDQSPQTP